MAWTYNGPGESAKDAVRFLIGDTDSRDPLLQDGEITWVLGQYNNAPMNAAIRCCETIISKFSRLASEKVGQVSIEFQQKAKGYRDMLRDLRNRLATEDMTPYAGGISRADMQQNDHKNLVRPDFTKHMMENQLISPWVTRNVNGYFAGGWGWNGD